MEDLFTLTKQTVQITNTSKSGWITIQHLEQGEKTSLSSDDRKKVAAAEEASKKEIELRKKQKRAATDHRH